METRTCSNFFALIAFSDGKPVSTPDQVRGRLFPENALADVDELAERLLDQIEGIGEFAELDQAAVAKA